jgi:hypothetical protein
LVSGRDVVDGKHVANLPTLGASTEMRVTTLES